MAITCSLAPAITEREQNSTVSQIPAQMYFFSNVLILAGTLATRRLCFGRKADEYGCGLISAQGLFGWKRACTAINLNCSPHASKYAAKVGRVVSGAQRTSKRLWREGDPHDRNDPHEELQPHHMRELLCEVLCYEVRKVVGRIHLHTCLEVGVEDRRAAHHASRACKFTLNHEIAQQQWLTAPMR